MTRIHVSHYLLVLHADGNEVEGEKEAFDNNETPSIIDVLD